MPTRDKAVVDKVRRCYDVSVQNFGASMVMSEKCMRYVNGEQWTASERKKYSRTHRRPITVDIMMPTVNTLIGNEQLNRRTAKVMARNAESTAFVDLINRVIQARFDSENFEDKIQVAFSDALIRPAGGVLQCQITTNEEGYLDYTFRVLSPTNVHFDDYESCDLSDCNWVVIEHWMTLREIRERYGESEYIKAAETENWWEQLQQTLSSVLNRGSQHREFYDKESDRYCVLEMQERVPTTSHIVVRGEERRHVSREKMDELLAEGWVPIAPVHKNKIHYTTVCPALEDVVLIDEDSKYGSEMFDVFPIDSYQWNIYKSRRTSLVASLIDPQDIVNKRISHVIDWANKNNSGAIQISRNEQEAIRLLQSEAGRPDLVLPMQNMQTPARRLEGGILDPTVMQSIDMMLGMADRISGVNAAMRGQSERSGETGVLFEKKVARSAALINPYYQNIARCREMVVKYMLETIPTVYREEYRIIYAKADDGTLITKMLNMRFGEKVLNDINNLDAYVLRTEGEDSVTARDVKREEMIMMVNMTPPQLVPWAQVWRSLGLVNGDEMANMIEQNQQQQVEQQQRQQQLQEAQAMSQMQQQAPEGEPNV